MPEGDAVLRTAQHLHAALAGDRLAVAEVRWGRVDGSGLVGAITTEVVCVGKHLLHRVDSGLTLHTHLRMEGRWQTRDRRRVSAALRRSPQLRVLLSTERTAALGWNLGLVEVVSTDQEHRVIGHLGPDLLGPGWDEAEALTNLRRDTGRPLAEALLDQRNLAGLGTIFTSEPLFMERVNPWTVVGDVADDRLAAVVRRAKGLLETSMARGRPVSTGDPREPMYVFGRRALPCRRCGKPVRTATVGAAPRERMMAYCPRCQHGWAPTDDGADQRPLGAPGSGGGDDLGVGRGRHR